MDMLEIISDKRFGKNLSDEQLTFFISGVTDKSIPDYQIAALLMAIVLNGMSDSEMTSLAMKMAYSGDICDLSPISGTKVDKHSSGGVGDKCTLIVLPIVAACGVPVAKLSGRGLGFTGGTIDKLESISSFSTAIPISEFVTQIKQTGMVLSGQTPELAPADKYLYALRDVTGTVESIPLIASSIMSKKIAGGADAIVLDVTCGSGAFMKNEKSARALSDAMIRIGKLAGRPVTCVITSMEQPLGFAIGNVLEVAEAYDTLSGHGPADVIEVSCTLSACMLMHSEMYRELTFTEAFELARGMIDNGKALGSFRKFVVAQGGQLTADGSPKYTSESRLCKEITATDDGYICRLDALSFGEASMLLGAGRQKKEDVIDPGAGILLCKKIGDRVSRGDVIARLFIGDGSKISDMQIEKIVEHVELAISISADAPIHTKEILAIMH